MQTMWRCWKWKRKCETTYKSLWRQPNIMPKRMNRLQEAPYFRCPSSTLVIPLDDNKINAKSTEITDLTYQYDDKKYLQKKTVFVIFFVCFFSGHLRKIYWSECIFQPRQHFWQRTNSSAGSIFKIYICFIYGTPLCIRKLERQKVLTMMSPWLQSQVLTDTMCHRHKWLVTNVRSGRKMY